LYRRDPALPVNQLFVQGFHSFPVDSRPLDKESTTFLPPEKSTKIFPKTLQTVFKAGNVKTSIFDSTFKS
jgi:hypothetical protein